jgi:hypothetical protein
MRNIIIASLLAAAASAGAQQVWRCGNDYGTQSCAGGSVVKMAEPPTAAEAARAGAAARADARRAEAMEQARLQREKQAPGAVVIGPAQPPAAAASATPAAKKAGPGKKQPQHLTAVAPGKPAAREKKKTGPSG